MEEMGWIKRDPVPGPKTDKWRRGQQLPEFGLRRVEDEHDDRLVAPINETDDAIAALEDAESPE
jgi:hypothetical protein